jgi:hypothetical protein
MLLSTKKYFLLFQEAAPLRCFRVSSEMSFLVGRSAQLVSVCAAKHSSNNCLTIKERTLRDVMVDIRKGRMATTIYLMVTKTTNGSFDVISGFNSPVFEIQIASVVHAINSKSKQKDLLKQTTATQGIQYPPNAAKKNKISNLTSTFQINPSSSVSQDPQMS